MMLLPSHLDTPGAAERFPICVPVHTEPSGASRCRRGENESVGSRPLDDTDLVERCRQGDVAAYEELVCRYQEIAFSILGSAAR